MSARPRPPLRLGDPLPPVLDHRTKEHIGHAIPVEGTALVLSVQQEQLHAFRNRVSVGSAVRPTPMGAPPAILTDASGAVGVATRVEHDLEKALCAAAHAGSIEVVQALCRAGVAERVLDAPPLAAAAVGRQAAAARVLIAHGAKSTEASNFLRARGEDEAAAWLMRR